jgi:hypothetical protein
MRWLQIAVLMFMITGCLGTFDQLIPIEGEIVGSDGRYLTGCSLEARNADTGQQVKNTREQIEGRFRTGISNPPRSGQYFLAIDCGPSLATYRSPEFDFSISKPIDLGRIVLKLK